MTTIDAILTRAAILFGFSEERLCAKNGRGKRLTAARQAVMWATHEAGYTLTEIGRLMGGRDHTTIGYGRDKAAERAQTDHAYRRQLYEILGTPEPTPDLALRPVAERHYMVVLTA
jgi:chromosomal replication initiator protein